MSRFSINLPSGILHNCIRLSKFVRFHEIFGSNIDSITIELAPKTDKDGAHRLHLDFLPVYVAESLLLLWVLRGTKRIEFDAEIQRLVGVDFLKALISVVISRKITRGDRRSMLLNLLYLVIAFHHAREHKFGQGKSYCSAEGIHTDVTDTFGEYML